MNEINKNFANNQNVNFKSEPKSEAKPTKTFEEYLEYCLNHVIVRFNNELKKPEPFKMTGTQFLIPNTNNMAVLYIEAGSDKDNDKKRFNIGIHNQYRDRLFSNTLFKGSDEEIIEYIKNPENKEEIITTINELSKKTDDFYAGIY